MKKTLLISVFTATVLTMTGCGSSDDANTPSNNNTPDLGTPSKITTQVEAEKAFAASSQAYMGSNSNKSAQRAASFIQKSSAQESSSLEYTYPCADGGTSISSYTDDTYQNGTITYDNCTEDGLTFNGTLTITDGVMTGTTSYTDQNGHTATVVMSVANGMEYITVNGISSYGSTTYSYDTMKLGQTVNSGYYQQDCVLDSYGTETCGEEYYIQGTNPREDSIDGGLKIDATAADISCFNGTYIYTTEENLHYQLGTEEVVSGILDINGVKFEFNSDSTATVTYTDGSTDIIDLNQPVTCN